MLSRQEGYQADFQRVQTEGTNLVFEAVYTGKPPTSPTPNTLRCLNAADKLVCMAHWPELNKPFDEAVMRTKIRQSFPGISPDNLRAKLMVASEMDGSIGLLTLQLPRC